MADSRNGLSSFWTQADALFRKNLTFQKRNLKTNLLLILFPIMVCLLLVVIEIMVNNELEKSAFQCGCTSIDPDGDGQCQGSDSSTATSGFLEPALYLHGPVYYVQSQCGANFTNSMVSIAALNVEKEIKCVQGLNVWRNSSSDITKELYSGYRKGNAEKKINAIPVAYDFLNSNMNNYNMTVWYNSTYRKDKANLSPRLVRVPRSINLAVVLINT
ncbi:ABC2-like protein [Artemisia annua]|uniref:ABC2-like protein n=1 Tax=Artemisia annua TaxID=35608 RepID=A0A2U1KZZ8_ARTAN|nr:ABC2-like protein [Artemisia annua]